MMSVGSHSSRVMVSKHLISVFPLCDMLINNNVRNMTTMVAGAKSPPTEITASVNVRKVYGLFVSMNDRYKISLGLG